MRWGLPRTHGVLAAFSPAARASNRTLGSTQHDRIHSSATAQTAPTGIQLPPWTGNQREAEALRTLLARFQSCPYGQPTEEEAKWFLRDRSFDPVEAYDKLSATLQWRSTFQLDKVTYERVAREDATGKAYLHEHFDIFDRPVLIIRVARHEVGQFSERESQELCVYHIEKAIRCRPPGVENVLGIFDLRNFGARNADFAFVRFLIQAFFMYYPKRAGEVLMVDAPWAFMAPYELVKPALGKYSQLIRFVSLDEARSYFHPDAVPIDFQ